MLPSEIKQLPGRYRRAFALSSLARHEEAVSAMERTVSLARSPLLIGTLGLVYARAGRHEHAQRLLQEL